MDTADREPRGHTHGIETSLLPLKKRASNYSSGRGRITAGDPYASSPSKKKRTADNSFVDAKTTKDTTGAWRLQCRANGAPCQLQLHGNSQRHQQLRRSPQQANAVSESDEEKERLSKGKWLPREESSRSPVTVTPQPPVKKLVHDGIRSFVPLPQQLRDEQRHAAAAAAAEADDYVPLPLHASPAVSSALKQRLAELGATQPWLVHSKTLHKSDVDENQNRLLVSCKRGSGTEDCPITLCFSPAELERVKNMNVGVAITALDRDGVPYALTCKFLGSNNGYRFITEWKRFLIRNGMNLGSQKHKLWTRDVEVELWAFRSRQLPFQPQLDSEGKVVRVKTEDENGKEVTVVQRISHHLHADGALGLLLLHHENRRRVVKSKEEEEDDGDDDWEGRPSPPPSVARKKGKQQNGKRGASASASPVALHAPVVEQGEARRSDLFYAAVGLEKLRQANWDRWKAHADGGQGAKSPADVEEGKIDKK